VATKPSLIAQYKSSLKNPFAEELIDLAFFRPLAFLFVKVTEPLPLTPNFVSLLAMVVGIGAGIEMAGGTAAAFALGAILFGLSNIFDCSDGMIARLKKNGTKTGRIVDGMVDYIASGAVYIGFAIGMTRAVRYGALHLPFNPWILMLAAVASTILHSISSDYYRNAFIRQERPGGVDEDEFRLMADELARLKTEKGHIVDKLLISIYLRYLAIQKSKCSRVSPSPSSERRQAVTPLQAMLWNLIGPSTHITFVILAAATDRPAIFFIFAIGAANAWMVGLFFLQVIILKNKKVIFWAAPTKVPGKR
jgi:phosphatidylglycerophosphate synthase